MSFCINQFQGGYSLKMAFKIEIRQNPEYFFLTFEEIDEIAKIVVYFC